MEKAEPRKRDVISSTTEAAQLDFEIETLERMRQTLETEVAEKNEQAGNLSRRGEGAQSATVFDQVIALNDRLGAIDDELRRLNDMRAKFSGNIRKQ